MKLTDEQTGIYLDFEKKQIGQEPGTGEGLTTREKMRAFARLDKRARALGLDMPKVKIKENPRLASPLIRAALAAVDEEGES